MVRCGGALVVGRYVEQVPVLVALLRDSPLTLLCRLEPRMNSVPGGAGVYSGYQVRIL